MQIFICDNKHTYIWNQHIPLNAWYGQDGISWWFCTKHWKEENYTLTLYRFNGVRWVKLCESSETTRKIYQWASVNRLWRTKCYWFKEEDKQKSFVTKQYQHEKMIQSLMSHDRKHKSGGSGIRLDKENFFADRTFTDYECTDKALNDFPRIRR